MQLEYCPHINQAKIHAALRPYKKGAEVMAIAGRRFGKTVAAVNEIIKRAIDIPSSRIWYLAPTKDQAYNIAWRLFLYPQKTNDTGKMAPPFLPAEYIKKKREDRHFIELNNGSLIEFKGLQDEVFLLGAGLDFAVFDEFPTIPWSAWFDIVRPMLADSNGDVLFIGTVPDPKIHNITLEFLEMYEDALVGNLDDKTMKYRTAFNFSSFDNPFVSHKKLQRDIDELIKKGRGQDAQRLYYGKYTREYGLVFTKFNYDRHTVEPFLIPPDWTKAMAVDPHPQKPINALWVAVDPRGHHWFYREDEFMTGGREARPLTVQETAFDIISTENSHKERMYLRFIDPTFAKIEQKVLGMKCIKDLFRDYGLIFREANRDFMMFFNRFGDMLVEEPEPMVHIFRNCHMLIRQLQNYMWDTYASPAARADRGKKDKPKKKDDDLIDCMKYLLNANLSHKDLDAIKQAVRAKVQSRLENRQFL